VRPALTIALLDLRRRLRDRTALMTAFVAPFVLAGIMGLAFGSGNSTAQVRVALVDDERTAATASYVDHVVRTLSFGPSVTLVRMPSAGAARAAYDGHRVSATIELRPGSSQRIGEGLPALTLVKSTRTRPLGKAVADAFVAGMQLRRYTLVAITNALRVDGANGPNAFTSLVHALDAPPPVAIAEDTVRRRDSPLGYYAPSMGIVFLFLLVGAAANSVLAERTGGTMARLQAAPIGVGAVVVGKTISIVTLMLMSVFALWGATAFVFGAHWGAAAGVVLLATTSVLAIGAIGLFITVSARDLATAQAATAGVGFLLALLGGNFFPPGSLPPFLERAALFTPNGWALDGFTTLSLDGGGVGDVLRPAVVLALMAVVVGAAALVRFRRTLAAVPAPA
jgi:linearmycin/streptolysin S transport system permease protein